MVVVRTEIAGRAGDAGSRGSKGSVAAPKLRNRLSVLAVMFLTLFVAQFLLMAAIDEFFVSSANIAEHLRDAVALSLVATPLLYVFAYRRLLRAMDRQKETERSLQELVAHAQNEEAWTRSILDAIGDGISIQDRDFRVLYQNKALSRIFGNRTGEFCYRAYEGRDKVCEGCGIALAFGDGSAHTVVRSVHVEGRGTMYAEITSSPLRDSSGRIVAGIEAARDITERKAAEDRIRMLAAEREALIEELRGLIAKVTNAKREWQETFDSIPDRIFISDAAGRIIRANRSFFEEHGVRPDHVIGQAVRSFFSGTRAPQQDFPLEKTTEDGETAVYETLSNDGSHICQVSLFPLRMPDDGSPGAICIMRDITEQKEQDARLVLNERLAALGEMASGIAHEINNPLAAIAGCAEGLLHRIDQGRVDPEFFRNYLSIVHEEIFRCKNITSSMLSFVRQSAYEKKIFDVHETIRKAIEIVGYQGRFRNVAVETAYASGGLMIAGSEGEIRQVMLAILSNAADAMEEMGTIRIATAGENGLCSISIADEGPGIPLDRQTRIFDPFYTTKQGKNGTGLGLAIAARIMNNHGGSISVQSSPGNGATFKVILPLYVDSSGPESGDAAASCAEQDNALVVSGPQQRFA